MDSVEHPDGSVSRTRWVSEIVAITTGEKEKGYAATVFDAGDGQVALRTPCPMNCAGWNATGSTCPASSPRPARTANSGDGLLPAVAGGWSPPGSSACRLPASRAPASPRPVRTPPLLARLRAISVRTRLLALVGWSSACWSRCCRLAGGGVGDPGGVRRDPGAGVRPGGEGAIARLEGWRSGPGTWRGPHRRGRVEQALVATLRSTPAAIKPEVSAGGPAAGPLVHGGRLVGVRRRTRRRHRRPGRRLPDPGARRRGTGLASVLQGLAESVAEDVTIRRRVEADRAKPRRPPAP